MPDTLSRKNGRPRDGPASRGVERLDRLPGNMFETGPCLRFPRQAQFHPLKYVSGLLKAIRAGGGRVFSNAHVTSVDSDTPIKLETSQGSVVTADAVVIATNTPINNLLTIHTKQAAYISYVIGATHTQQDRSNRHYFGIRSTRIIMCEFIGRYRRGRERIPSSSWAARTTRQDRPTTEKPAMLAWRRGRASIFP
jgi:glycine/D-amino acid oxidase-like deaminating enzyme